MNKNINRIMSLECEVYRETQELINKKRAYKKWFEEVGNEIIECFWEIDKTLTLKDIKELLPGVIQQLENTQEKRL